MTTAIEYGALACVAAGLLAGLLALVVTRDFTLGLRIALDLWLAAGLLRLALPPDPRQLLAAAALVVVRQLVGRALGHRSFDRPSRPPWGGDV
jgi:hypothetical protein